MSSRREVGWRACSTPPAGVTSRCGPSWSRPGWWSPPTPKLAGYAQSLAKPALAVGKGAVSVIIELFTLFVLVLLLLIVGVPFPLLWGLWVALVDFLPMIGGALAGIPAVLFAFIATAPDQAHEPRRPRPSQQTSVPTESALARQPGIT